MEDTQTAAELDIPIVAPEQKEFSTEEKMTDEVTETKLAPKASGQTEPIRFDIFNRTVELSGNTVSVAGNKTTYKKPGQAKKAYWEAVNKTVW